MAEQDDAQQGEGEQEEHRASATDGLTSVRDAAVRAMGLQESLRGTLSLAESLQSTMGMAEAVEQWRRQFDSLSVGAEIRRLHLDSIDSIGIGRELLAERMASIGDSMAGFSQSVLADLAQEMNRVNERAARQMAALMPAVDTSAWLQSLGALERQVEPRPAAPARPQPAPQPPRPQPQPPAPASPILRLMSEVKRLSPDEVEIGVALEMMALLADLVHGSGERLPYAGKPDLQQEAIAVYEHYLRHKHSHRPEGIAALFGLPFATWRRRLDAGEILWPLQFAKSEQKSEQRPA